MKLKNLKERIGKIEKYAPSVDALQTVLDSNTLTELRHGKVFITDKALNDVMAKQISKSDTPIIENFISSSHSDGKMEIEISLQKLGTVVLIGSIQEFRCKNGNAIISYQVEEHRIRETKIISWLFSQISLGVMQKFIDIDKIHEDIDVNINGNLIIIDLSRLLASSRLGTTEVNGIRIIDMLEIEGAIPKDRGIEISAKLNAIGQAKERFKEFLKKKMD